MKQNDNTTEFNFSTLTLKQPCQYYRQALPIFQAINDQDGEAKILLNWGVAYGNLEQFQKAIDYDEKALTIFRELGNRQGEATAFWVLRMPD